MDIPLNIVNVNHSRKTFHLIQETTLYAGSKQRGIKFFQNLKDNGFEEIVTCGTTHGYGQVAAAFSCKEVGLACTIFLAKLIPRTKMTNLAIELGAKIIDIDNDPKIGILMKHATTYTNNNPKIKLLHLGLDDPNFIQAVADNININKGNINPKRMWLAVGSGTLLRALHKVFPDCHYCIVQVGRCIYPDIVEGINHTIYKCTQPFRENTKNIPPYESLANYDAKVWQFVSKHGSNGDYIWNVK
jgi:hypothetical protein